MMFSAHYAEPDAPAQPVRLAAPPMWEHQKEAYTRLCNDAIGPGTGLWMDMGTGKSRVVIEYLNRHLGHTPTTLILCPLSVIDAWITQFDLYGTKPYYVLPLRDNLTVKRKVEQAEAARALAHAQRRPLVVVVNYEAAWRPPFGPIYDATGLRQIAEGFALSVDWDVVVCDEIHRVKDPEGRASRFVSRLGEVARKRIGLSGTPMPHSPLDLYALYRFLDPAVFGPSFFAFKHRYAITAPREFGGKRFNEVVGYQHQDEMREKMYSIAYRVKASDVLDLPPALHTERTTALEPSALKMYRQLYKKFVVEVEDGIVTASNALVKLLRLQQLTSGYLRDEDGADHEVSQAKRRLLGDVLLDLPTNEPVVVFCKFHHDLDVVAEVAKQQGRMCGELSGRRNDLADWQGEGCDVLAVQIQSGGVGIDLTRSRYCIYFSLGYSLGDYEQSLARLHRPGQQRTVEYLHLLVSGTVDALVYAALRERKDVVAAILEQVRGEAA